MTISRDTVAELVAIIIDLVPENKHELLFMRLTHTPGNKSFRESVEKLQAKYSEDWARRTRNDRRANHGRG